MCVHLDRTRFDFDVFRREWFDDFDLGLSNTQTGNAGIGNASIVVARGGGCQRILGRFWALDFDPDANLSQHFRNIDFFDARLESRVDEDANPFDHFVELAGCKGLNDW